MEGMKAAMLGILLLATQLTHALSSPATVPAFLWSPHGHGISHYPGKELVNYRTISPEEFAKLVLSEGSWSNLLCSGENHQHSVNFLLVFIGKKLRTSDISRSASDPSLVELLRLSFTSSNTSMAFPFIAVSDETEKLENTLISEFTGGCGHGLEVNNIAYLDSCSVDHKDSMTLGGLNSLHEYMKSKMDSRINGKADMIVFCSEGLGAQSDGELLSGLVSFLDQLGAAYSVLYASDPYSSPQSFSYQTLERFLLEDNLGNAPANLTSCDGVCQIKSSLLEGLFVGIVLLIILISGLCCMMGIETPSRFETPQES